jgi:hypothetical protein
VVLLALAIPPAARADTGSPEMRREAVRQARAALDMTPAVDSEMVKTYLRRCWRAASHGGTVIFTCRGSAYFAATETEYTGDQVFSRCAVRVRVYFRRGRFDGYNVGARDCALVSKGQVVGGHARRIGAIRRTLRRARRVGR